MRLAAGEVLNVVDDIADVHAIDVVGGVIKALAECFGVVGDGVIVFIVEFLRCTMKRFANMPQRLGHLVLLLFKDGPALFSCIMRDGLHVLLQTTSVRFMAGTTPFGFARSIRLRFV